MENVFFVPLYAVLIYDNFRYTEYLYTFMVEEGFDRSSLYIETVKQQMHEFGERNNLAIFGYIKLTLASIFVMITNMLPSSVQPYIKLMFAGVNSYH
jgi:hypothetical protein